MIKPRVRFIAVSFLDENSELGKKAGLFQVFTDKDGDGCDDTEDSGPY